MAKPDDILAAEQWLQGEMQLLMAPLALQGLTERETLDAMLRACLSLRQAHLENEKTDAAIAQARLDIHGGNLQ